MNYHATTVLMGVGFAEDNYRVERWKLYVTAAAKALSTWSNDFVEKGLRRWWNDSMSFTAARENGNWVLKKNSIF